jgi:hypothetical protein
MFVKQFLRTRNISAQEAVMIGIDKILLQAPKKHRAKYGPRREISSSYREEQTRERNREHAKATRKRRKLFREVIFKRYRY